MTGPQRQILFPPVARKQLHWRDADSSVEKLEASAHACAVTDTTLALCSPRRPGSPWRGGISCPLLLEPCLSSPRGRHFGPRIELPRARVTGGDGHGILLLGWGGPTGKNSDRSSTPKCCSRHARKKFHWRDDQARVEKLDHIVLPNVRFARKRAHVAVRIAAQAGKCGPPRAPALLREIRNIRTCPGRVCFFKFYRVGRVRDASAAVSP
eukprot:gene24260-biopygen10424